MLVPYILNIGLVSYRNKVTVLSSMTCNLGVSDHSTIEYKLGGGYDP